MTDLKSLFVGKKQKTAEKLLAQLSYITDR